MQRTQKTDSEYFRNILFYFVFHTECLYLNAVLATVLKGTRVDLFNHLIYFDKQRQLTTGNNTCLFVISKIIFHHKVLHPLNAGCHISLTTINLITGITAGTCSCQNQQTIPDDTCLRTHWYLSIQYRPNFCGPVDK